MTVDDSEFSFECEGGLKTLKVRYYLARLSHTHTHRQHPHLSPQPKKKKKKKRRSTYLRELRAIPRGPDVDIIALLARVMILRAVRRSGRALAGFVEIGCACGTSSGQAVRMAVRGADALGDTALEGDDAAGGTVTLVAGEGLEGADVLGGESGVGGQGIGCVRGGGLVGDQRSCG